MEIRKKIDNSLKERHGILRLLERLKKDDITLDEIEEIGVKLQKAGKRALSPLVRRLWRERSGDLISRYAYLLDFFEDEVWLDQLILMALRRRDLEEEGKTALLAALEGYGVDLTIPPFAALLAELGGPLRQTLPRLLDKGEEGVICFVEDLLFAPAESRLALIRELPSVPDPRVLSLLEVLLRVDDRETAGAAIGALGRIRESRSVALLQGVQDSADAVIRELAEKGLRRLSFTGLAIDSRPQPAAPLPFYATCASPVDGAGYRTVWLCRWTAEERLTSLYLQIHESRGLRAAWGESGLTPQEGEKQLEEVRHEEGGVAVPPDYALQLVGDAIFRCRQEGAFLPADYYLRSGMFQAGEIKPAPYSPDFTGFELPGPTVASRLIAESGALFDDDFFAGWFLVGGRVYDFAEEWIELERTAGGKPQLKGMESLVERFCGELLAPETEVIRARLRLTADLMRRTGREREVVEQTLAVAASLAKAGLPHHRHPFLKRFALESMDMAREALAEGYDLREHPDDED
jgi:HEAT repeats